MTLMPKSRVIALCAKPPDSHVEPLSSAKPIFRGYLTTESLGSEPAVKLRRISRWVATVWPQVGFNQPRCKMIYKMGIPNGD